MNKISKFFLRIAMAFESIEIKASRPIKRWLLKDSEVTMVPTKEYKEMKVYFQLGNEQSMATANLIGSIRRLVRNEKTDKISKTDLETLLKDRDQKASIIDKKYKPIIDELYHS